MCFAEWRLFGHNDLVTLDVEPHVVAFLTEVIMTEQTSNNVRSSHRHRPKQQSLRARTSKLSLTDTVRKKSSLRSVLRLQRTFFQVTEKDSQVMQRLVSNQNFTGPHITTTICCSYSLETAFFRQPRNQRKIGHCNKQN